MRPKDARYNAIRWTGAKVRREHRLRRLRARRSPIPYVRYQQAEKMKRDTLIKASKAYFQPWESIPRGQPAARPSSAREPVALRPLLIMQGDLDDNVLPSVQQKFADTYRAAGGDLPLQAVRQQRARVNQTPRPAARAPTRW